MCLSTVESINCDPKGLEWKVGYKVCWIFEDKPCAPYIGGEYGIYNAITDEKYISISEDYEENKDLITVAGYRSGFHIWTDLSGAERNLSIQYDGTFKIFKVKYRRITATGMCDTGLMYKSYKCDVALEMQLLEVLQ